MYEWESIITGNVRKYYTANIVILLLTFCVKFLPYLKGILSVNALKCVCVILFGSKWLKQTRRNSIKGVQIKRK